jgi:hypothetical protein
MIVYQIQIKELIMINTGMSNHNTNNNNIEMDNSLMDFMGMMILMQMIFSICFLEGD